MERGLARVQVRDWDLVKARVKEKRLIPMVAEPQNPLKWP